jgi:DNA polymerase elongation subunit (family B)
MGYQIKFHEIYFYKTAKNLFKPFIQLLFRQKFVNSGFPANVDQTDDRELFCKNINNKMEYDKINEEIKVFEITNNPAERLTSKIFLNSLLGRFLLNESKFYQTKFLNTGEELQLNYKNVASVQLLNEKICQVNFKKKIPKNPNRNINCIIGLYVTSLARVYLLKQLYMLENIGAQVVYCDCDSIFFYLKNHQKNPLPMGYSLGEFQNIFSGKIEAITILAGKCYSVMWRNSLNELQRELKVCGFSFLYKINENSFTHETIDEFVTKIVEKEVASIVFPQLMKTSKKMSPMTKIVNKKFTNKHLQKRILLPDYTTVPFGYH